MMIFRAIALILLPIGAMAQECGRAATQADMGRCAAEALAQADVALNAAWAAAMGRMHAVDDGLPDGDRGAAQALRDAQRAWIVVRDKGCGAEAWAYAGGTMRPFVETSCRTRTTEARTETLRALAAPAP